MKNIVKSNDEQQVIQEETISQLVKDDSTKCNSDDNVVLPI